MKDTDKEHEYKKILINRLNEKMAQNAVLLLSGGLDSSVSAYMAKQEGFINCYALSFRYGQQHQKEIQAAKRIAQTLSVNEHLFFDLSLDLFGGSSLLKKTNESIPKPESVEGIGNIIPSTYVPARNTIFLSIALSYAETKKADAIFIGVTASDYSGYPDCRPEYIKAYQQLANLATKRSVEGNPVTIKTPLLHLSKKEIVQKGNKLDVPFEKTWSCYNGEKKACGHCDSCLLRLKGFKEAEIQDPLPYSSYPPWYNNE